MWAIKPYTPGWWALRRAGELVAVSDSPLALMAVVAGSEQRSGALQ